MAGYNFFNMLKERPKSIIVILVLSCISTLFIILFSMISFEISILGAAKVVLLFLTVYTIKLIISYLNRLEFIRVAHKYNIKVLKNKREFRECGLEDKILPSFFFIEGVQINALTDFVLTTKEDINSLPKEQVRELYSAGLKLKLLISIISLIIMVVLRANDSTIIIFFCLVFIWGNTLRSLFRDESDIRHLINSFGE